MWVSVTRGFLFLLVLGIGCVILLRHSLVLHNYFGAIYSTDKDCYFTQSYLENSYHDRVDILIFGMAMTLMPLSDVKKYEVFY